MISTNTKSSSQSSNVVSLAARRANKTSHTETHYAVDSIVSSQEVLNFTAKAQHLNVFLRISAFHSDNETLTIKAIAETMSQDFSKEEKKRNLEKASESIDFLRSCGAITLSVAQGRSAAKKA